MTVTLHKVVRPTFVPCDDGKGSRIVYPDGYPGFAAERAAQAAEQELVNTIAEKADAAFVKRTILFLADREHKGFPQYRGYWSGDEWTLHKVTQTLKSKGGAQAEAGDIVLAKRGADGRTFYSVRLGWNCSGPYGLTELGGTLT